eukprot:5780707-Alexandrium_andersonii.AAC.1
MLPAQTHGSRYHDERGPALSTSQQSSEVHRGTPHAPCLRPARPSCDGHRSKGQPIVPLPQARSQRAEGLL